MQIPVPLVIVIVAEPLPPPLQTPVVVIATGNPELAVAATLKVEPFAALAGAGVVTVIVWSALLTVNVPEPVTAGVASPPTACTVKRFAPTGVELDVVRVNVDVFVVPDPLNPVGLKVAVTPVGNVVIMLKVPEQLAVVGFDGIPESAYFYPSLTTITQDPQLLGGQAVQSLVEMIEAQQAAPGSPVNARSILIPPTLVVRESSRGA